jgi:iron complex transport system ATP-binding protein
MKHQIEVMDLLKELSNNGISVLIALHDINMALRYADKFMMLRDGAVFAHGGREIITKKNIEHLYDVKVHIAREDEHVFIIPNGLQ